jgi:hypothetical protein
MVGEVIIRGEPGRTVRVDLPGISNFGVSTADRSHRFDPIRPAAARRGSIRTEAQLSALAGSFACGDADGQFRGDVRIDVDYF